MMILLFIMAALLIIGQSRSGKSTSMVNHVVRNVGYAAKVICDPQASLYMMALEQLWSKGKDALVRLIQLSNIRKGFGFLQLKESTARHSLQRDQENANEVMNFARILLNRSGLSVAVNRLIWEWLSAGLFLVLHSGRPLYWLPYGYLPQSERFSVLIRECREERTRVKMETIASFSNAQLRREIAPALRIAEICFDPAFVACCGNVDFDEQLRRRRVLIFSGDGANRESTRTLLIAAISKTIQFAEKHDSPVELYLDEWNNWDLITPEFGDAIASLQKKHLDFFLASQTLAGNEKALNKVIENSQIRRYFRIGDISTIRFAASDIGNASVENDESTIRHRLATLPTGAFYQVDHGHVTYQHPPKPKEAFPWAGLIETKIQQMSKQILSSPEYHDVLTPETNETSSTGEAETEPSRSSAADIPPASPNLSTTSQRARRINRQTP